MTGPRLRQQLDIGTQPIGYLWQTGQANPVPTLLAADFTRGSCADESHTVDWQHRSITGGPLTLLRRKATWESGEIDVTIPGGSITRKASGAFQGRITSTVLLPTSFTEGQMGLWGTQGWTKFKLHSPGDNVGMGQFLGELNQLPSTRQLALRLIDSWKAGLQFFKSLGSRYLNVVFGWLPFLRSIQNTLKIVRNLAPRWEKLRQGMDKPVRRGGMVFSDSSVTETEEINGVGATGINAVFCSPAGTTQYYRFNVGDHSKSTITQSQTKVWFAGKFRWSSGALPVIQNLRMNYRLFGFGISPKLVWDLLPFSWLVDWFTNVGDVLANVSDQLYGLVAEYAYIMASKTTTTTYRTKTTFKDPLNTVKYRVVEVRDEVKMRRKASPYGFGFTAGDLNSSQLAILVALGLSYRF